MSSAASRSSADEPGAIYKLDTIPPPDGEDDPYSAPTRVGPMAQAAVEQMFGPNTPPAVSEVRPVTAVTSAKSPSMSDAETPEALPRPPLIPRSDVPRLFEEFEEGDDRLDPTSLFGMSQGSGKLPKEQSGQTLLLSLAMDVPSASASNFIPARKTDSDLDVLAAAHVAPPPETHVVRLVQAPSFWSFTMAEIAISVACFLAIVLPCLWFFLLR